MLNKLKNVSWINVGIIAIFVLIGLGGALAIVGDMSAKMNGKSTKVAAEAQSFASNIPDAAKIECNDIDGDGTGYISCTVFRTHAEPLAIECASAFSLNHGCRLQKNIGRNFYDR